MDFLIALMIVWVEPDWDQNSFIDVYYGELITGNITIRNKNDYPVRVFLRSDPDVVKFSRNGFLLKPRDSESVRYYLKAGNFSMVKILVYQSADSEGMIRPKTVTELRMKLRVHGIPEILVRKERKFPWVIILIAILIGILIYLRFKMGDVARMVDEEYDRLISHLIEEEYRRIESGSS